MAVGVMTRNYVKADERNT